MIELNKVTWYSKLLAVLVFAGTFFAAYNLGETKEIQEAALFSGLHAPIYVFVYHPLPTAPAATAPSSVPTATTPKNITITPTSAHKTIVAHLGDSVVLQLGEGTWDLSFSNPSILSRKKNLMLMKGVQGVYTTVATGTTTVTATSHPACFDAVVPCKMPTVLIKATVTVQK